MRIDDVFRGLVTGALVGFILLYSLRPKVPYPSWILITYEHPWLFVLLAGAVAWLAMWDRVAGALSFIALLPIVMDYHMLGKRPIAAPEPRAGAGPTGYTQPLHEGPALADIDMHELDYPLFVDDQQESLQPGEPSPF